MPKPVVMTNGTFAVHDNDRNFPHVEWRTNYDLTIWDFHGEIQRTYSPFPLFHLGGFLYQIMLPIYTNSIPVYGPPLAPPTAALIAEILERQDIHVSCIAIFYVLIMRKLHCYGLKNICTDPFVFVRVP